MLSTLLALSSLTFAQASGGPNAGQGESVFPKPEARNPEVLRDRSIFQYMDSDESASLSGWAAMPDWSGLKYAAPKASATKLRVLLLVFERDFSNPQVDNTLELNDKQRLILSMSRISRFFSSMSNGELDVEVVPRFVPEPVYTTGEMEAIQAGEYNRFKFDADDRVERGPFHATLRVLSSGWENSFERLGGNEPGFALEQNLIEQICEQLIDPVASRLGFHRQPIPRSFPPRQDEWLPKTPWISFNPGLPPQLLDATLRDDAKLLAAFSLAPVAKQQTWVNGVSQLSGSIEVSKEADALIYTESSIIRSGAVILPSIPYARQETGKSMSFEVRTKCANPLGIGWTDPSGKQPSVVYGIGSAEAIKIKADGTWQTVTIPRGNHSVPFIAVPSGKRGVTRNPHEIIRYEFRNFRLSSESASIPEDVKPTDLSTLTEVEQDLNSGVASRQRRALTRILQSPSQYKSLQPKLLEMSTELEPAVAFGAVQAYGKIGIANDDLIGKTFMNRLVSTAPNEYAREAALLYFAEHPEQTTFEAISPNIVRRSWRTRIATVKALAALDKTDLKAKPAARQLLLTACGQDMAIIRSAALAALKADVEPERKQLEYSLVNDPSEQVRLQCLKQLGDANAPKEILFGALADDSPYVREHVYEQLPLSLKREALQRMVIDRDTYVRAAALYGFAKLPDPTQPGEIQNTFSEEHPAVLLALVEGAQKGKWKLPANVIENARKSKSPLVKEGLAKLEGK